MKVLLPDFTSPIFWLGMILIAIYAYIGGKWLDKRNKAHNNKLEDEERKNRIKNFKSGKI
jgi:C4-dicarboxylate transporter